MREESFIYPPMSQILPAEPGSGSNDLQIVEQNKPLSQCVLWSILQNYYLNAKISAWDDVPSYVTNNRVIGETYAELVIALLLDIFPQINPEAPLYILEPAAGTGCFSAHFLEALTHKRNYFENLKKLDIQYILTDFSETNFSTWEDQPRLKPFRTSGILHFAILNPEQDQTIQLFNDDRIISKDTLINPLIVLANYFFDSIRHDFFMAAQQTLHEVQLTFFRELSPGITADSPLRLRQLRSFETLVPIEQPYYKESRLNKLLEEYKNQLQDTPFLFPIGGLNCILNLQQLSNNKLILLSSDKGTTKLCDIASHLSYVLHGDGFSFFVNYHAIQHYFKNEGGQSFQTDNFRLITSLNILLPGSPFPLENTRYLFEEKLIQQNILLNHCDGLYIKTENLDPADQLKAFLSHLQQKYYEPMALYLSGNSLMTLIPLLTEPQKLQLIEILDRIKDNLFFVRHQPDLWATVGAFYYHLGQANDCLAMMETSVQLYGKNAANSYYQQVSQHALNLKQQAMAFEPQTDLSYFQQIVQKAAAYT